MRLRRVLGMGTVLTLVASAGLVAMSAPAGATVFTPSPDPTVDGAAGSLRDAVNNAAAGGDEIHLVAGGTYTLNACGAPLSGLGQLVHGNAALTIKTPSGAPATIVQTCLGARVLQQGAADLTIDNVIITGGNQGFPNIEFSGGAIRSFGNVIVTSSTLFGNTAQGNPANGGAIAAQNVTVTNSTIRNNSVQGNPSGGGAISGQTVTVTNSTFSNNSVNAFAAGEGGAIQAQGAVTVTGSTFTSNSVLTSGTSGGGAIHAVGPVTIASSTLSNNNATGTPSTPTTAQGGAIRTPSTVAVTGSTLSNNSAVAPAAGTASGGGIFGSTVAAAVTVTNSTISDNTASDQGGGIFATTLNTVYATIASNGAPTGANIMLSSTATLTSFTTVVTLPQGGGANCANLSGTTTNGYNFADDASCGFTDGTDDQTGADPLLAALAPNGGPTQTRLPQTGSPLIDAIPNASCQDFDAAGITTDQRSLPRPSSISPSCDIGAVEVQATPSTGDDGSGDLIARFAG